MSKPVKGPSPESTERKRIYEPIAGYSDEQNRDLLVRLLLAKAKTCCSWGQGVTQETIEKKSSPYKYLDDSTGQISRWEAFRQKQEEHLGWANEFEDIANAVTIDNYKIVFKTFSIVADYYQRTDAPLVVDYWSNKKRPIKSGGAIAIANRPALQIFLNTKHEELELFCEQKKFVTRVLNRFKRSNLTNEPNRETINNWYAREQANPGCLEKFLP